MNSVKSLLMCLAITFMSVACNGGSDSGGGSGSGPETAGQLDGIVWELEGSSANYGYSMEFVAETESVYFTLFCRMGGEDVYAEGETYYETDEDLLTIGPLEEISAKTVDGREACAMAPSEVKEYYFSATNSVLTLSLAGHSIRFFAVEN